MNEYQRETLVQSEIVSDVCKILQQYWHTSRLYSCM